MGKLVRDRIPEIIRATGREPVTRVLDEDEYSAALHAKLSEEAAELRAAVGAEVLEEAADVLEVLQAIAAQHGHSLQDVVNAASKKARDRGGFMDRIWLA